MVLGYGGFLHYETDQYQREYREKLLNAKIEDLKKQEIVKTRLLVSNRYLRASGIGGAFFSGGLTLISAGVAQRKLIVAKRKLVLIKEELTRRGEPLHEPTWKDIVIPLAACMTGTLVGVGIEVGIGGLIPAEQIATGPLTSVSTEGLNSQIVTAEITHPHDFIHGFWHGFEGQGVDAAHHTHDTLSHILGLSPGAPTQGNLPVIDFSTLDGNLAQFGGAALGVDTAAGLEQFIPEQLVSPLLWRILEACEAPIVLQKAAEHYGCRRLFGATEDAQCNSCNESIAVGNYWHCCACDDDNYDLCNKCYDKGVRCNCEVIRLTRLQFAWAGFLYHPEKKKLAKKGQRYDYLTCNTCSKAILQGRYYECFTCGTGNGYHICLECYSTGRCCSNASSHPLFALTWAHAAPPTSKAIYNTSGGGICERCDAAVFQGVFYHCDTCLGNDGVPGHYDLCQMCYETTGGCSDALHVLERVNAFGKTTRAPCPEGSFCDMPDCKKSLVGEALWYQCSECKVENGEFAICALCTSAGGGCHDHRHHMKRVLAI